MPSDIHARRRARFMEAMGDGVAVIAAAPERPRNGDNLYTYRQDSDLWYLTGFPEPEAVAVLVPGAEEPFVLFVRPKDREKEIWTGRRAGVEGATDRYDADAAHVVGDLEQVLPELLKNHRRLYYRLGRDPAMDRTMERILEGLRARVREGVRAPTEIVDPAEILHEMRLRKGPEEIEMMRRSGELSAEGHVAAMRASRPGLRESDLQAVIEYVFKRGGADYVAYPSIVAGGANACVLHYGENDSELKDGDLVLIDAGAEVKGYAGDITRTFPVNGKFTDAQRRFYQVVLDAQLESIEAVKPGAPFQAYHDVAVRALTKGMVELGLLEGAVDDLIATGAYRKYYMHRTGHWIGLDVHDAGAYFVDGTTSRTLEPGMVVTVEPGLYVPEDDPDAPAELRGVGVRIEDDVVVTESGREILTPQVPKEPGEIERLMAEAPSLPL